jgi:hypothetical protein
MPNQYTTQSWIVSCAFSGQISVTVRDANWNAQDPNNSSCEASCSMNIMVKRAEIEDEVEADSTSSTIPSTEGYALFENYPNPFNPTTTIRYYIPEASHVRLSIVNTIGKTIMTLVDDDVQPGMHVANWNANANHGALVPSGSYFYRIHATSLSSNRQFVSERLMLLLK